MALTFFFIVASILVELSVNFDFKILLRPNMAEPLVLSRSYWLPLVQNRKLRSSNLPLIVVPISMLTTKGDRRLRILGLPTHHLFLKSLISKKNFFWCMTCNFYAIPFCSVKTIITSRWVGLQQARLQWKHFKAFSGMADGRRSMEK